ncbi:MAG: hypothetical protein BWX52_00939 [Bacteroidetes bacterium ADurb.Bin013]|nr:MAG: hypothetical protein BWX52_00939 [Bacteroidetes bacterium ADurb.Bin013]
MFGSIDLLVLRIVSQVCGIIQFGRIQGGHLPDTAGGPVYLGNLRNNAGIVDGGIDFPGLRVEFRPGNTAQRFFGKRAQGCQWKFPDTGNGFLLIILLPFHPLLPDLPDRASVNFPELPCIECPGTVGTDIKVLQFVYPVLVGQVGHKTGAVQIGIGSHLEILCGSFRIQPYQGIEVLLAFNDAAEVHLVIKTHGPPESP